MNYKRFSYLLSKYSNDLLSFKEENEFFEMVATGDYDGILLAAFENDLIESTFSNAKKLSPQVNRKIVQNILDGAKKNNVEKVVGKRVWLLVAAAVLAILFTTVSVFFYRDKKAPNVFITDFIKKSPERFINTTNHPLAVFLPDSSCITLQPNASIFYSTALFNNKREVCMEGEAMFKITKNPLKPFYVFYNNIVTKVLGTSFNIHTNLKSGNIEVEVLTGKVQVFENEKVFNSANKKAGIIVTPNQKAVYVPNNRTIAATLVDHPVILTGNHNEIQQSGTKQFDFDTITLSELFKRIESNYGVQVIVNDSHINECVFSGNLSNVGLYDKLRIICLSVNAGYEIKGTDIIIKKE